MKELDEIRGHLKQAKESLKSAVYLFDRLVSQKQLIDEITRRDIEIKRRQEDK